jgi:site-specific DNA-methyltransferase (adenine-specific)
LIRLLTGDCRSVLRTLDADSIDSCVTDPPYHLTTGKRGGTGEASVSLATPHGRARVTTGFMGMTWDGGDVAMQPATWAEVYRVLKPGAHLVAFGGTRTYHRLVCAIEDAGFEVRDQLAWLFASGFPKGTDKAKIPEQWKGWNTALKPAHEPIVLARKPMIGTLAENLARYGTGALWIDGCRVGWADEADEADAKDKNRHADFGSGPRENKVYGAHLRARGADGNYDAPGRWPANVLHDGSEEVIAAFPQSTSVGHAPAFDGGKGNLFKAEAGTGGLGERSGMTERHFDTGSAARFFWSPKASRADRNEGLQGMPEKPLLWSSGEQSPGTFQSPNTKRAASNHHPTVKPTDLMRYLCRLVTPPGGVVLDPFAGSGSTLKGAELEGFKAIGIELNAEYVEIARRRIGGDAPLFAEVEVAA